jgi:hypothetical protein
VGAPVHLKAEQRTPARANPCRRIDDCCANGLTVMAIGLRGRVAMLGVPASSEWVAGVIASEMGRIESPDNPNKCR